MKGSNCSWMRLVELLQSQSSVSDNNDSDEKDEELLLLLRKEERMELHIHLRWAKKQQQQQQNPSIMESLMMESKLHIHFGNYIIFSPSRKNTNKRKEKSNITLACQVLCNCVTMVSSNIIQDVVWKDIPFEYNSSSHYKDSILDNLLLSNDDEEKKKPKYQLCWVDIIQSLVCQHENRFALEAIMAAIYNSYKKINSTTITTTMSHYLQSAKWFWTCLMRYYLPISVTGSKENDVDDEATNWIALLVYSIRPSISIIYPLLGKKMKNRSDDDDDDSYQHYHVTPEQVVFFHALLRGQELNHHNDDNENNDGVLFLVELIRSLLLKSNYNNNEEEEWYEGEYDCQQSIIQTGCEYLANVLSNDTTPTTTTTTSTQIDLRQDIGSILMTSLLKDLYQQQSNLKKELPSMISSRNHKTISMPSSHSRLLVLVRLIGNLCFQCPNNQDLLQQNIIKEEKEDIKGLHILLNTTSIGNGLLTLFPLREWTIVAIRYAIEDHPSNQSIVASLQPQDFTDTTKDYFQKQNLTPTLNANNHQVTLTPNTNETNHATDQTKNTNHET